MRSPTGQIIANVKQFCSICYDVVPTWQSETPFALPYNTVYNWERKKKNFFDTESCDVFWWANHVTVTLNSLNPKYKTK